jgi:serine/threonine protein kinase
MCLKLADFGLAIDLREERAVTRAGTLDYMAPGEAGAPPRGL